MGKVGQVLVSRVIQGLAEKAGAIAMRLLFALGCWHILVLVVLLHLFNPRLPGLLLLLTMLQGSICLYT